MCENKKQLEKFLSISYKLPNLKVHTYPHSSITWIQERSELMLISQDACTRARMEVSFNQSRRPLPMSTPPH